MQRLLQLCGKLGKCCLTVVIPSARGTGNSNSWLSHAAGKLSLSSCCSLFQERHRGAASWRTRAAAGAEELHSWQTWAENVLLSRFWKWNIDPYSVSFKEYFKVLSKYLMNCFVWIRDKTVCCVCTINISFRLWPMWNSESIILFLYIRCKLNSRKIRAIIT